MNRFINLMKNLFTGNSKNISKEKNITYEDELLQQFGENEEKNTKTLLEMWDNYTI